MPSLKDARKPDPKVTSTIMASIQKINAEQKSRVIALAGDVDNPFMHRRPTGIPDLDMDLRGGFPSGVLCGIAGPEGAGKTALAYNVAAMQQRIYGDACNIAVACVESNPDHFFMRSQDFLVAVPDEVISRKNDARKITGQKPLSTDEVKSLKTQIGNVVVLNMGSAEETLECTLDLYAKGIFNLIIVDSLSALEPMAEVEAGFDDSVRQGASANVLTRFAHRYHTVAGSIDPGRQTKTTLLSILQVRANRDKANAPSAMQKYLPDYKVSIPWSLRHAMNIGLMITAGEKLKEEDKVAKKKEQYGKIVKWATFKGKSGVHEGITGEVEYTYEEGFNKINNLFVAGIREGVLKEAASGITVLSAMEGATICQFKTRDDFLQRLHDDIEFEMRLRMELMASRGIECVYWLGCLQSFPHPVIARCMYK